MTASWKKFQFQTLIRETDLDTYGHMNNARYLEIFELARWQLLFEGGMTLENIHLSKKGPIILGLKVDFKKEVKLRTEIRIETQVDRLQGRVAMVRQSMFNLSGDLLCEAEFAVAYFDLERRKLLDPTENWLRLIGKS